MRKYLLHSTVIFCVMLFVAGCKEASTEPEPYLLSVSFSIQEGQVSRYNVDSLKPNLSFESVGYLHSEFITPEKKRNTEYLRKHNTFHRLSSESQDTSYWRETAAGIYMFFDTTGFGGLIPDSLRNFTVVDEELIRYSFPLEAGRSWSVYKFIIGNRSLIDVVARVDTALTDMLYVATNPVMADIEQALGITYIFTLTLPDFGDGEIIRKFEAKAYLVDGIGEVRLEGNKMMTSLLIGGTLDFTDTTTVFSYSLTSGQ